MGYSPRSHKESDVTEAAEYTRTWNLEKWYICPSLLSRNRDTDVENTCMDTNRWKEGWEIAIDIYTLLILTNENLLPSWENGSQCSESEGGSRSVSDSLPRHGLCSPWNSPGQNTGVGSLFLLQGIFPMQGQNSGLPHCRQILYQLSHKGNPCALWWPRWEGNPKLRGYVYIDKWFTFLYSRTLYR